MSDSAIVWNTRPIQLAGRLDDYSAKLRSALQALLASFAARIETAMKVNARWTDRTGAARQGLRAFVEVTATQMVLYAVHSVAYGVDLERKLAGRYAIIAPTLETYYSEVARAIRAMVGGR